MKFPRQKEVFYLRQILLRFSKTSFDDCLHYDGRQYSSYEEAPLATGLFTREDEARLVLQEMVDL
eukprot:6614460-Pyramimonas_sp.AAC.1